MITTKRIFDFTLAFFSLLFLFIIIILTIIIASIDTKSIGLFVQERIGQFGKPFMIFKVKTINDTTKKVTYIGMFMRKSKLDELPQLYNILKGEMSFVGPRPDVAGYYDKLQGEEKKILELKPGLTSEASIKYANEEDILSSKKNPLEYNDTIIFPDKVNLNLKYYKKQSILLDLQIIINTIIR